MACATFRSLLEIISDQILSSEQLFMLGIFKPYVPFEGLQRALLMKSSFFKLGKVSLKKELN